MLIAYDFEVFSNTPNGDWCCVLVDLLSGKETKIVNDSNAMKAYFNEHKDFIFCGYNSRSYDVNILKAILLGISPARMNDWIIKEERKAFELDPRINELVVNSYDAMYSKMLSLKRLEAFMGDDIEETSVPFDKTETLTEDEWKSVLFYCEHDVFETIKVMTKSKEEFFSQWGLIKEFNLPLRLFGKTKTQLTAEILECSPRNFGDEWDIPEPDYECKIEKTRRVYDWFFDGENLENSEKHDVELFGVPHTFGLGGCHSAVPNFVGRRNILSADVASFYPSLMIQYDLLSRATNKKERFEEIYKDRLRLKAEGKKKEQAPRKIVLNSTYGASGDKYNKLYDPRQGHRVCVTGQIMLTDLEEQMSEFSDILQSNTDGVLVACSSENKETLMSIGKDWEKRTRMNLEYDYYPNARLYQRDVNNYLLVSEDKKHIKGKGAVVKSLSELDNDLAVVNKAVRAFFIDGTEPSETVLTNKNLIDFQKIYVKSSKYEYVYWGAEVVEEKRKNPETNRMKTYREMKKEGQILNNKTFRVFASLEKTGTLMKSKGYKTDISRFSGAPENLFVYNKSVKGKTVDEFPKLDKIWYINKVWEEIIKFVCSKDEMKKFSFEELKGIARAKVAETM